MSTTPQSSPRSASRPARLQKCPGCHLPHSEHNFGEPNRHCTGPPPPIHGQNMSPASTASTSRSSGTILKSSALRGADKTPQINSLNNQLALLRNEEEALMREIEEEERQLLAEIEQRRSKIQRLKATRDPQTNPPVSRPLPYPTPTVPQTTTVAQQASLDAALTATSSIHARPSTGLEDVSSTLRHHEDNLNFDMAYLRTHHSSSQPPHPILPHIVSSTSSTSRQSRHQEENLAQFLQLHRQQQQVVVPNESELLMRPTRTVDPTKGKPLRIVDFVSRLRPTEEERVLSRENNVVLSLTVQDSKPKLSSVTVEQFNIANLRIFHELLFSGKLSSMLEIREYLAYSVKVLQLAAKNTWQSVLQYDDEFRILQHTYGYPWSKDHSHLHEVTLVPRWASHKYHATGSNNSNSSNSLGSMKSVIVSHLPTGEEICRLYNSRKGCQRTPCKYSHVCNRKVGSQACGKAHPGHLHSGDGPLTSP